jgi:CHAD domain-containing protein
MQVLKPLQRKFRRQAAALEPDTAPEEYHATRVRGKRLRYALEAMAPVFGSRGDELILSMRQIQDLLGDMQDCSVSVDLLRNLVTTAPGALPAATLVRAGALMEQRRHEAARLREDWPDAFDAWKRRAKKLRRSARKAERDSEADQQPEANQEPEPGQPVQARLSLFQRLWPHRSSRVQGR